MTPVPKKRQGRYGGKLTPTQEAELWAWYQARQHLGTYKVKAREYGVTQNVVWSVVRRIKARIARNDSQFIKSLRSLPF